MKKIIALILFVLYFVSSNGATINFHYCMGKLAGWDISFPVTSKCGKCGMSKKNKEGCCNDKKQTFKPIKEQVTIVEVVVTSKNTFCYLHDSFVPIKSNPAINFISPSYLANSPPLQQNPLYILNGVFRI